MADIPDELRRIQNGFGASISVPFLFDDNGRDYELQVDRYDPHVVALMVARGALSGAERLGVYNQQYWFRLLDVMQEEYPLLADILGLTEFNQLTMAYLDARPPRSRALRDLSNEFANFLTEDHRWNRDDLRQIAALEFIYIQAFDAAHLAPRDFSEADEASLMHEPLTLQPHFHLLRADWDVVDARRRVKKGESGELAEGEKWWAIYRGKGVTATELGPLQFRLLRELLAGRGFGDAIETVAESLDEPQLAFLAENVRLWFALWTSLEWFAD